MDEENSELPAWFVSRMMEDQWSFGFLMVDGTVIGVQTINAVKRASDGTLWLDVELMPTESDPMWLTKKKFNKIFSAPTERTKASINASHVMAAFELADT